MLIKNGKKKKHPILAVGIGAMAVYGAYSIVSSMKDFCCKKAKMITKVFKNKEKCVESSDYSDGEEP